LNSKGIKNTSLLWGYLSVLVTALLWSTGGLFIKLVPWSGFSVNAGRCLIAFLFKVITRRSIKIEFNRYTITGGLAMAATTTLFAFANKLTTSANAIVLQYAFPMFLIAFICISTKSKPRLIDVITSIIMFFGVLFCCLDDMASGGLLGNILAFISALTFALYFFINSDKRSNPDDANCIGFLISFLIGIPSLLMERDFTFKPILFIVILGAFQLGLAYMILEYGIKHIPAVSASFISTIEPVMNPVWVAIFYNEKIGIYAIIGAGLVIGATLFYSIAKPKIRPELENLLQEN